MNGILNLEKSVSSSKGDYTGSTDPEILNEGSVYEVRI